MLADTKGELGKGRNSIWWGYRLEKLSPCVKVMHSSKIESSAIIFSFLQAPQPGCENKESLDLTCSHFQVGKFVYTVKNLQFNLMDLL